MAADADIERILCSVKNIKEYFYEKVLKSRIDFLLWWELSIYSTLSSAQLSHRQALLIRGGGSSEGKNCTTGVY